VISKFIKQHYFTLLLVPYAVGTIGMLLPKSREFFMSLTPLMLIFSFILVVVEEGKWTKFNVLSLLLIFISGFAVEYIGVNTGYLFGDYQYGTTLGPKLGGVPITIAMNWAMLCIASRSLVNLVTNNKVVASAIAAAVVTAYDVLLEPVAIKFSWWWWDTLSVPIFNYVCWFGFSFIFQLWFRKVPVTSGRSYWMIFVHAIFYWILLLM
jgi:putative membrane protein